MTTPHLSMDLLLTMREPLSEPGNAAAREHLHDCPACQAELTRLHQRVARLKALPSLQPMRDGWPDVAARFRAERWRRRSQVATFVGLAMAASLAVTVVTRIKDAPKAEPVAAAQQTAAIREEIHQAKAQSRLMEDALRSYDPSSRVVDGRTNAYAQALEERIAKVDRAIEVAQLAQHSPEEERQLWLERVRLLGDLVNVHVTRASGEY